MAPMQLFFVIVAAVVCGLLVFVHPFLCIAAFIILAIAWFQIADLRSGPRRWGVITTRCAGRAFIREGELEYLLGRHHRHREVRPHVRLARPVYHARRANPVAAVIFYAIVVTVLWRDSVKL